MKEFWFIESVTPPPEPVRVDGYHYFMFHGTARRHGAKHPLTDYALGDVLEHPVSVTKNVYEISLVFQPATNLIASEFVAGQLAALPNVELLEVKYEKLFWTPYEKGRFDHEAFEDEDELLGREKHDPSLTEDIGRYFEVIVARLSDVAQHFDGLVPVRLNRPGRHPVDVEVSDKLLEEHPMLWWHGILLAGPAAEIVLPHLDQDYFECTRWEF